ncbi:MAG: hypothetical protein A2V85_18105 [Chloroflexi bacterium RBG_16_72_14]|nr:MAG: hypothetical protein A2V85_18105 [Chloroflexi bacterium RBG_16_72_14]
MTDPARPASAIDEVAARFWEDYLRLSPTTATMYGDTRYDDRLEDPSAEGRAAARALAERVGREAGDVSPDGLPVEERITRDMLLVMSGIAIEEDDLAFHELRAVDQIAGPQTLLAQVAQFQPGDTPERLEKLLARIIAYGPYIDAHIEILEEGRASGRTAARIVAERTIQQLERLLAIPVEEAIVPAMASVASEADRERVREVVRDVVYPADRRYLEALRGEYLAATREAPGLHSAPGGTELYRHAIRFWTTLDMDPRDVHQVGMDELAMLTGERLAITRAEGFGDDIHGYRRSLAQDPANQAPTQQELVARATEDIERAAAVAPSVFGRLPRAGCEVRPVEEFKEKDAPFAYYFPPTLDGSRPGIYYVNTYDLPSRTFSKLASTTFHEAIPGHHFQISLEMEHPSLNVFRRLGARMVGGAYVEGWGLYSERLADELGLYRNAAERFGMLDAQAWRASRLIVDSGMHGLGWTRQQSIDWLLETGLSETDAVIETDRYIAWPGQALTYMTGMREIRRLRRELEARDGAAFDLKAFHDELLGHGSLPLATLARELPRWVATPA